MKMQGRARSWVLRVILGGALASLAACGGGGSDAKFNVDRTEGTQSQTYEGEDVPSVFIHARVDNPDALSGETLYLIAEATHPELFESTFVSIDSDEGGGQVQLIGAKAPAGAMAYNGTIVLRACLDSNCDEELSVKGGRVAYQIEVKRGLTLSSSLVELSADFGVMPDSERIEVGLPEDLASWKVEPTHGAVFSLFDVEVVQGADGSRLLVSPRTLWLPGETGPEYATITAITESGATLVRGLEIWQRTGPVTDRAWAFERPVVTFNVSIANGGDGIYNSQTASALLPRRDSDRFHYLGTTYEWPAQADDSPLRDTWLSDRQDVTDTPSDSIYIDLTVSRCYSGDCLPEGRYRAVMHYRYEPVSGPVELIDHEVIMNITP